MTRFLLVHDEWGLYLGCCLGMGFFTKMDTAGQFEAVVFPTVEMAMDHIKAWDPPVPLDRFKFMPVEAEDCYATIEQIKQAGIGYDLLGDMEENRLAYMPVAGRA